MDLHYLNPEIFDQDKDFILNLMVLSSDLQTNNKTNQDLEGSERRRSWAEVGFT